MAEEQERKNEESKSSSKGESERKKRNLPLIGGIIGGVILVEAVMLYFFLQMTKPKPVAEPEENGPRDSVVSEQTGHTAEGIVIETPVEVIVNIAGTDGARFLKAVLLLEYNPEKYPKFTAGKEGEGGIKSFVPKFKNILIDQLSSMTLAELNEPDAKNMIRRNFLRSANMLVPPKELQFTDVLIDQFIIQ